MTVAVRSRRLTREKLAEVFRSPELIRAFEAFAIDITETLPDAADAALTLATDIDTRLTALENDLAAQYALIYDQDAEPPTLAYLCEAPPGTLSSAAAWRIQRLAFGVSDGDITVLWADGNQLFDNVADNRASLTYS